VLGTTNESGYVVSPKFNVPGSVNVQPQVKCHGYAYKLFGSSTIDMIAYVGAVESQSASASKSVSIKDKSNASLSDDAFGAGEWLSSFVLSESTPYISVSSSTNTMGQGTYFFLYDVQFRYAE
jgi:hypothetical protein